MSHEPCEKPPLGVTPSYLWREHRKLELTRALHEYIRYTYVNELRGWHMDTIMGWCDELKNLVNEETP